MAAHAAHRCRPDPGRCRMRGGLGHERDGLRRLLRGRRSVRLLQGGHDPDRHHLGALRAGIPACAPHPARRVLHDPGQRAAGHVRAGLEQRPDHRLPRPRADDDALVPADRPAQDRSVQQRGRPEVLPARQLRQRHHAVRNQLAVRPHRHHQHRRDRRVGRGPDGRRPPGGDRVPAGRRRVQDRGGAVPLLDPGRVPGGAYADHRVPVGRAQARCLRPPDPCLRGGPRAADAQIGSGSSSS